MDDYTYFIIGGALVAISLVITYYLGFGRGYKLGRDDARGISTMRVVSQARLNDPSTFWSRS